MDTSTESSSQDVSLCSQESAEEPTAEVDPTPGQSHSAEDRTEGSTTPEVDLTAVQLHVGGMDRSTLRKKTGASGFKKQTNQDKTVIQMEKVTTEDTTTDDEDVPYPSIRHQIFLVVSLITFLMV